MQRRLKTMDHELYIQPKNISAKSPLKTRTRPIHCRKISALPRISTENKTVKNFRVVVATEHANGPYVATCNEQKIK